MKNEPIRLQGKKYWRSLDHLAETPEFTKFIETEFPDILPEMHSPLSRRNFLTIMGASLALAGLAGCRKPVEKIIPYTVQPEEVVPGIPQYYATSMPVGLSACGLVVESHEGRPTKIEGNDLHPSSLGKSNAWMQAEILNLYDPDRSDDVYHDSIKTDWSAFVAYWRERLPELQATGGRGLAVVTEPFSSPTETRLKRNFKKAFPNAGFIACEPLGDEHILKGIRMALGRNQWFLPKYHYDRADVVLALECDFLTMESENVTAAGAFASRRAADRDEELNRLYVVESDYTSTGVMADHRLRMPRRHVTAFVLALADELKRQGIELDTASDIPESPLACDRTWLRVVASDLIAHRGKSIVVGGRTLPPVVHDLLTLINNALGNTASGGTIEFYPAGDATVPDTDEMKALIDDMAAGRISTLIMLGGNPAYTASGMGFARALGKVEHSIHLSSHLDETSQLASWHINRAHFLEAWGDTRAFDGTTATVQPLIAPLFGGISASELLNLLATGKDERGYEIVRETWRGLLTGDFETGWRKLLHDGIHAATRETPHNVRRLRGGGDYAWLAIYANRETDLELAISLSPTIYDGRYANNGWLQELPHPVTKLTWDNAACLSPATAERFDVVNGDVVAIEVKDKKLELPVWIVPGLADDSIQVALGYGRTAAGRVGNGVGVDVYGLFADGYEEFFVDAKLSKTGRTYPLASTQDHGSMEGRPIVREATAAEYADQPNFATEAVVHPPLKSIFPDHDYSQGYQWGMAIDLNRCVGCNACLVACQSENNIPVVGKDRVAEGREMHWIRLDRYFTGETDNPEIVYQPVTCQHCENAPCEQVCPVQATSHDREGLNVMTYNRCVGTRYCSNNCPYKVRRFNFFNYTKETPEVVKMAMNPDVTVRSRGVMEKCTFCTQRINRAKITAKLENRTAADGDVRTACQQACPADAIVFGNINDPDSRVAKIKTHNLNYELLGEFNVRPRNSYLARIRNPHPELDGYVPGEGRS